MGRLKAEDWTTVSVTKETRARLEEIREELNSDSEERVSLGDTVEFLAVMHKLKQSQLTRERITPKNA